MFAQADPSPWVFHAVPNRCLGRWARRWVLAAISTTTLGVAAFAAAIGAWPVMPYAGLEVAVLVLAFRVMQRHDGDFERLEVGEHEVRWEARDAHRTTRFVAHRPWARVLVRRRGWRCTLHLSYAGRSVPLGRLLSDEGRHRLAEDLRGRMTVTVN